MANVEKNRYEKNKSLEIMKGTMEECLWREVVIREIGSV
jgi:hypothetical protein